MFAAPEVNASMVVMTPGVAPKGLVWREMAIAGPAIVLPLKSTEMIELMAIKPMPILVDTILPESIICDGDDDMEP